MTLTFWQALLLIGGLVIPAGIFWLAVLLAVFKMFRK